MRLSGCLVCGAIASVFIAAGAPAGVASDTGAGCGVQLESPSQVGSVANGGKACGAEDTLTVAVEPAKAPPSAGRQAAQPPGLGDLSDAGFFTGLGAFLATKGVNASVPALNLDEVLPVSP